MNPGYNVRKAAQVAAFFVREEGGQIAVLKLAKLLYLADRKNMELHDFPILGDNLVSMDHGPVTSIALNYINGMQQSRAEWDEFISDRSGYAVGLTRVVDDEELDELSLVEIAILRIIWAEHGHRNKYELRDWTHDHCLEWEDPHGSSEPIPYERVFKFLGKANASELADDVRAEREIRAAFASA